MKRSQKPYVFAVPALVLLASASALAQTSEPIGVECHSSGQLCSPAFSKVLHVAEPSTLTVEFGVAPPACSSIRLFVRLDGTLVQTTRFLDYPVDSTGPLDLGVLSSGDHTLSLQAEGMTGGCNGGLLGGWGGTLTITLTPLSPLMADLSVTLSAAPDLATTGNQLEYTIRAANAGPDTIDVTVAGQTPVGTTLASFATSQGELTGLAPGAAGAYSIHVGPVASGQSVDMTLAVNVGALSATGPALVESVTIGGATSAPDPNPQDNAAETMTTVVEGAPARLSWSPPPAGALAPPEDVSLMLLGRPGVRGVGSSALRDAPVLQGYRVYRSNHPNTQPSPGNFYTSVPPTQTSATTSVMSGGTFFVVTAVYDQGESAASEEVGGDVAGPTVARVRAGTTKLTAVGDGFQPGLQVFVDGIPYSTGPRLKKRGTKVVQTGTLLTGQTIGQYLTPGRTAEVSFRNPDGGITRKTVE